MITEISTFNVRGMKNCYFQLELGVNPQLVCSTLHRISMACFAACPLCALLKIPYPIENTRTTVLKITLMVSDEDFTSIDGFMPGHFGFSRVFCAETYLYSHPYA